MTQDSTGNLDQPAFTDAASCATWLGQLQLTNLNLAQSTLHKQLEILNRATLSGSDRFAILETLRETITLVQQNISKKMGGKKLPLSDEEFTPLITLNTIWHGMLNGYLRCINTAQAGELNTAQLCQRTLLYASYQIADFVLAGYEPGDKLWLQFHAIYAHSEKLGVSQEAVVDEIYQPGVPISCRALYATTLLLHRARLAGISRGQWQIVERWLCRWSDALSIEPRCSVSKQDAPPLAIDLAAPGGLMMLSQARQLNSMRYMAMVPLSKQVRVKAILLQQGKNPAEIELGSDIAGKDCFDLLNNLHASWCEPGEPALADAPRPSPSLSMCIGIDQIYAQLSGKPFRPPKDASKAEKDARSQIETFGRVLNNTGKIKVKNLGFVPEEWLVDDDGLLRGRFLRAQKEGERLGPHQLVSLFQPELNQHKAGLIELVRVTRSNQLYLSVHYFPGHPEAIFVRGNTENDLLKSGSSPALLLPAIEKLRVPASLVLPRDWFSPGRKLELNLPNNTKQNVVLGFSVEKGVDSERVSFKQA